MKRKNESGRSMVEMLAVLVIFAILSLLGIVGFDFMKERQYTNELMDVAVNIYNVARTKGHNTTTDIERMSVPRGVGRMDANVATRSVVIYRDPVVVNEGVIRTIENSYGYTVTEDLVVEMIGDTRREFNSIRIQF